MFARWIGMGIIAVLLTPAAVASAQTDIPDLKGAWSGTAEIVHRSAKAEHIQPTAKPTFLSIPFTITIEQQEGRGFAGSLASARSTDPLIGRVRSDGRRLHMVDDDGTLTGELVGPDAMELCRTEVTPHSMNVYCATLTRKR